MLIAALFVIGEGLTRMTGVARRSAMARRNGGQQREPLADPADGGGWRPRLLDDSTAVVAIFIPVVLRTQEPRHDGEPARVPLSFAALTGGMRRW